MKPRRSAVIITAIVLGLAVTYVAISISRPEPETFAPSSPEPRPAEGRLVGPTVYTIDARDPTRWQFFSFSLGTLLSNPRPYEWDLAFRRFQVIVNGGDGFSGLGGVIDLGEVPFDSVEVLPEDGYVGTEVSRSDSIAAPLGDWYSYSYFSHLLSPVPHAYAVRTGDGRYAKVRFLGYYCSGAQPGCVTFEYVYQGSGGRELTGGLETEIP